MLLSTAIVETTKQLISIDNPSLEAKILLQFILGIDDVAYISQVAQIKLSKYQQIQLKEFIRRRQQQEPIEYIVEKKSFWNNSFYINKNVLIPRTDSETIIEATLKEFSNILLPLTILEIGVGSGCLILSLLEEYTYSKGIGVDISLAAIKVAMVNYQKMQLNNKFFLINTSLFNGLSVKADLIISNPPYISIKDKHIASNVQQYEPYIALFAPEDGLYFYKQIFSHASDYLNQYGKIIVEVGHTQKQQVISIAHEYKFHCMNVYQDIQKIDRVLVFQLY